MIIKVKVNTNSKKEEIIRTGDDSFIVKFHTPREKGLANKKLLLSLATFFNVTASNVKILHGQKSSNKIIEIS